MPVSTPASTPATSTAAPADTLLTLAVDCGGSGIKGALVTPSGALASERIRIPTTYPLTPTDLIEIIATIADALPGAYRVGVGMPGMIRAGVVVATPHYITTAGPFTDVDPALRDQWFGFDMQSALTHRLGLPTLVLNDADAQGCAVITGHGLEVVFTLGTGFGTAYYLNGVMGPHLEISHAPVRKDTTYDQWIGDLARRDIGNNRWTGRVIKTIDGLRSVFQWERLYLGGGNTKFLVDPMAEDVTIVSNIAGIIGSARAWDFMPPRS